MVNSLHETLGEVWKTIGRSDLADNRSQKIPFEVKTDDGSIKVLIQTLSYKNGNRILK